MTERRVTAAAGSRTTSGGSPVYAFDLLRTDAEIAALVPEWADVFTRSGSQNPFAHPTWLVPWLRQFARAADDRVVVAVRKAGELVGVAPLYWRDYGLGPVQARSLQLAGGSPKPNDRLTEMSEVLALPSERRKLMRALVRHLAHEVDGWDWLGVTLSTHHGWFESEWLPDAWRDRGAYFAHKGLRTFVVLPLPASWSELRLKRNMKEALRRSKNRLAALEGSVETTFVAGDELPAAVESLIDLHRRRAQTTSWLAHDDYFDDPVTTALVREAAPLWAAQGGATAAFVRVDGEPIAGRLLLEANKCLFLSFSGFEPELWRLGASATLTAASIQRAIADGAELVNFSRSPDSAKLRWSEQLDFQHEFVVVPPSRRAHLLFSTFWQLSARRSLAHTRRLADDAARGRRESPFASEEE